MKRKRRNQRNHLPERTTDSPLRRWVSGRQLPYLLAAGYLLVFCALAFAYHPIGDYGVETDFYWAYAPHAKDILSGHLEVDPFKGPGYEIVLAIAGALVGEFFRAGIIISLISAAGVILLTYKLVARLFNQPAALFVTLGLATNFTFMKSTYTAGTDMLFNLLAVGVLFLLLRKDELRLWDIAAAGLLTGFAYITRYNGVSFYLAVVTALVVVNVKGLPWGRRFAAAGTYIGASMAFVIPWGLYCLKQTGQFFYNRNHLNIAYEIYAKGTIAWDDYWHTVATQFDTLLDVVLHDPTRFFGQIAFNGWDHFWKDMSLLIGLPMGLFALGGIVALAVQGVDRRQLTYLLFAFAFYLVLLPVFYGERFSLYLAAPMLLLAVTFFQWEVIPPRAAGMRWVKYVAFAMLLLYGAIVASNRVAADIDSGPTEILKVRDAFAAHYARPENAKIVARKPHIAYYLDMKFEPFPYVDRLDELMAALKNSGSHYLFFSSIEAGMRPQFRQLIDPRSAPPGFVPIIHVPHPPAVLYELRLP